LSTENKPPKSIARSVGLVASGTALSRVSGLLREQVMAYFFGAGMATDAFVTAFRIPNLLRDLFAEGALSSSFVPVFKERLVQNSAEDAFRLANIVVTTLLVVLGIITLIGIAATPTIIYLTAYGFTAEAEKFKLTVHLTRIMWVFLPLVSISALVMGMLNSFDRFGIPAMSSAMFNVGSIVTVVVLYHFFDVPVYTLAIGVVVGGIGQIAVQLPSLWRIGYRFRFKLELFDEGMKKMLRLFTPMVIGLSAGRINILVNTLLVSFLMEGSISYLNYAYRLMHFPLGVFAVALGTVALPRASELATKGDMDGLSKVFHETLNLNFFLTIPAAFCLAILGRDLVELIYRYGAFSQLNAVNTSIALFHYSYGLVGFAAVRTIVPVYYALGDARRPMKFSILSVGVNIALYWPLIKLMDFAGLAAATSIAGLVNFGLLMYYLPDKGIHVANRTLLINLLKITFASAVAMAVAWSLPLNRIISAQGVLGRIAHAFIPLAVAGALYIGICLILGVREVSMLKKLVPRHRKQQ
jgi:putative peptidoglycan lipid II flippase